MSESDRVQRWREAKRQQGLKPCTVWLTTEEELRLKDLAARQRCSPSEILQQALAQFPSVSYPSISNSADTELLREVIREEIGTLQAASAHVAATVTDIEQLRALIQAELAHVPPVATLVTDTVTATLAHELPALVRTIVEGLALEALGMPATATRNSDVTDINTLAQDAETPKASVAATNSNVTETLTPAAAPIRPAAKRPAPPASAQAQNGTTAQPAGPRKGGRPTTVRPRILDLLRAHPEGLTAVEIKVHLRLDKTIGDTLAGMVRNQLLTKQGTGNAIRYRAVGAPQAPPTASPAAPVPARRKRQTQPA